MRKKSCLIALIVLLMLLQGGWTKTRSRVIKPLSGTKKITVQIGKKKRTYYRLQSKKSCLLSVKGPGNLRVITRAQFKPGNKQESVSYEISYAVDGGKWQTMKAEKVKRTRHAHFLKGKSGSPGEIADFVIPLGRGYHNVAIQIKKSDVPVLGRFLLKPKKLKKRKWVAMMPGQFQKEVELVINEEPTTYYRFSEEKPLQVEVNGPTQLRFLTRVENHYHMKGRILYRLQAKIDGAPVRTYQLSSRRSKVAVYSQNKELVPGIGREVVLSIPKGRHRVEFLPLDKDKSTLLGRALIPVQDTRLEE